MGPVLAAIVAGTARAARVAVAKPIRAVIIAGIVGAAGGTVAGLCLLSTLGFTAGGVLAGSMAAAWQASIGNVAAGTLFAGFQAAAATGTVWGWGAAIGGALSSLAAAVARLGIR